MCIPKFELNSATSPDLYLKLMVEGILSTHSQQDHYYLAILIVFLTPRYIVSRV
jgi:hypothetical protein